MDKFIQQTQHFCGNIDLELAQMSINKKINNIKYGIFIMENS